MEQFRTLLTQQDSLNDCQEKTFHNKLLMLLEVLAGLTQTVGSEKINLLFSFFHPFLSPVVSLLEVHSSTSDIITSVLTFFSLLAENFTLFLNDVSSIY